MLSYCMDARTGVEHIGMMLSAPLPFPYVHLVCLLVHLSALFQCVQSGLTIATEPMLGVQHIAFELIFILAMNSLYCGLLCLAVVLWDPFGDDVVDFPQAMLHHQLWKSQAYATHFLDDDAILDMALTKTLTVHTRKKPDEEEDDDDDDEQEDENEGEDDDDDDDEQEDENEG